MRELKRDTSPMSMVYLPLGKRIREKVGEGVGNVAERTFRRFAFPQQHFALADHLAGLLVEGQRG